MEQVGQVGEELAQATDHTREVLDAEAQRLKEDAKATAHSREQLVMKSFEREKIEAVEEANKQEIVTTKKSGRGMLSTNPEEAAGKNTEGLPPAEP